MTNHSYGYRSDNELFEKVADKGVHWRNIRPLISGFLETKKVYENATAETRSILVRECSLIYECNVCRNLFRCLANFIKHKRLYCCTTFDTMSGINGNGYQDDIKLRRKRERPLNADDGNKSLRYLILKMLADERKRKSESADRVLDKNDLSHIEMQKKNSPLKRRNYNSRILKKLHEITKDKSNIGAIEESLQVKEPCTNMENNCDKCDRQFESRKSLQMHILKKHKLVKEGFQCPSCALTFPKPAEVMQHLSSEHKKSIPCIDVMRTPMQERRVLSDNQIVKAEIAQHEKEQDVMSIDAKESNSFSCEICKKFFQRKAALQTHQSNCIPSIRAFEQSKTSVSEQSSEVFGKQPNDLPLKATTEQCCTAISNAENMESDFTQNKVQALCNMLKKEKLPKLIPKHIPCLCKICNKKFNALGNLRRHISMIHYRTRKFTCKLCDYRAFRKYDVINHLGHTHQISGDKEQVSQEYVEEHAQLNVKECFDDDIVLVMDDKKVRSMEDLRTTSLNESALSGENISNTPEKNAESSTIAKCDKVYLTSNPMQRTTMVRKRQKLKRSISQQFDTPIDHRHKRPKRNRIAPVEKDFVYDLSTILSNEANETEKESVRCSRRRDTVLLTKAHAVKLEEIILNRRLIQTNADEIKGTAQKTAMLCVQEGRGALSSLPQLPSKRPQVRMRPATVHRTDCISSATAALIEAPNIKKEPQQRQLLDDSYLENLSKTTLVNFKMKPELVMPLSTINSLLKKVDQTLQSQMKIKSEERETCESTSSVNIPQGMLAEEFDGEFAHPQRSEVAASYSKYVNVNQNQRYDIMQCLVANKAQTSESLLRLALEN